MNNGARLNMRTAFAVTLSAILTDMAIKTVITRYFSDVRFMLIKNVLGFKLNINKSQMGLNNELANFGIQISHKANITLNIVVIIAVAWFLYDMNRKEYQGKVFFVCSCMFTAGAMCSLLDKFIWGGSPDYIYLFHRYIIDLKDIYLYGSIIIGIIIYIRNSIIKRMDRKIEQE